jgi:ATP diphosphatase
MTKAHDPLIFDAPGSLDCLPQDARQMLRLLEIMRALRDPDHGCPWDIEQDFESITPYTIEEAYEVADAVERKAWGELEGELGDLLLQVVYHAQMGVEAGHFDFTSVAKAISDKMVARHPHVFGEENRDKTPEQQTPDWEALKAFERAKAGTQAPVGVLDGVAMGLPAALRALKLQKRAARVGFDWPSTDDVLDKIVEEARELVEARDELGAAEIAEEFGDLMFVMVNLGRHLGVDAEAALRGANTKFTRRFKYIEDELRAKNSSPEASDLAEMDALWNAAKRVEKGK